MSILVVDPSINKTGWVVIQGKTVVDGGIAKAPPKHAKIPTPARARWMAMALPPNDALGRPWDLIVIEGQQVYKGAREDPNDLLLTAQVNGAVAVANPTTDVEQYKPREWTGGVPKKIRIDRLKKRAMLPKELAVYEKLLALPDNDGLDAMCLAYWWLEKEGLR